MNEHVRLNGLQRSPLHLLHRAGQAAAEIFYTELTTRKLTPRQVAVLLTVSRFEGISQTGLVERTGIDRSTLADIVRRLQSKGLLQRRRTKEDARTYAVRVTKEGTRALSVVGPIARQVDDNILSALPATQRAPFVTALGIIVQRITKPAA